MSTVEKTETGAEELVPCDQDEPDEWWTPSLTNAGRSRLLSKVSGRPSKEEPRGFTGCLDIPQTRRSKTDVDYL